MFRNNIKNLYQSQPMKMGAKLKNQNQMNNLIMPFTARKMLCNKSNFGMLNRMIPKRNFNSKIDGVLERLIEKLPQGNIGYVIAGLNTAFFGIYLMWPKYSIHNYLNNFSFSMYGLNKGYVHNLLTCHFSHQSFFSYAIDSVILFLLSQSLT
tara:strand:- start:416 stop:871 length:456 start_codon:yes stop_codon:yes gene_type:complete